MTDLKTSLSEAVGSAFAAEGVDKALARVTASDRPDLADFQSNGALAAAKALKANPRELAAKVKSARSSKLPDPSSLTERARRAGLLTRTDAEVLAPFARHGIADGAP